MDFTDSSVGKFLHERTEVVGIDRRGERPASASDGCRCSAM